MKTLIMDFNDVLAQYLDLAPEIGIATRELTFEDSGVTYQLSVLNRDKRYLLALRDEHGNPCAGFETRLAGTRHSPDEGEEAVAFALEDLETLTPVVILVHGRPLCRLHVIPQAPVRLGAEASAAQAEAWNFLYRYRTCPPAAELMKNDDRAHRHRAFCPACADLSESSTYFGALCAKLQADMPLPGREQPTPGQVWSLKQELAGWNEDEEFLRPQLVILVSAGQAVRAVPCCPANELALETDIVLGHGLGFAEPWNAMDLPAAALDKCFLTLDAGVLREIEARINEEVPAPVSVWRHHMLELETRVAETMRDRAILTVAQALSPSLSEILAEKFQNLGQALRQVFFPPEPTLARGAERSYVLWPLDGTRSERPMEITGWVADDQGLHVRGRLDLPDATRIMTVFAVLDMNDTVIEPFSQDAQGPYFQMTFPPCPEAGTQALRLVAVTSRA